MESVSDTARSVNDYAGFAAFLLLIGTLLVAFGSEQDHDR